VARTEGRVLEIDELAYAVIVAADVDGTDIANTGVPGKSTSVARKPTNSSRWGVGGAVVVSSTGQSCPCSSDTPRICAPCFTVAVNGAILLCVHAGNVAYA